MLSSLPSNIYGKIFKDATPLTQYALLSTSANFRRKKSPSNRLMINHKARIEKMTNFLTNKHRKAFLYAYNKNALPLGSFYNASQMSIKEIKKNIKSLAPVLNTIKLQKYMNQVKKIYNLPDYYKLPSI